MSKGSDAGASPIDAEKAALEWLDECGRKYSDSSLAYLVDTLKALLAEPRLPAEPSWRALKAMTDGYAQSGNSVAWSDAYRALYAHLTAPKTKMVWRVRTARLSQDYDDAASAHGALWGRMMDHDTATIERCEVPA